MKREWKPGDVAIYDELRVMRVRNSDGDEWIDTDGDRRNINPQYGFRPLVVIDPEDMSELAKALNRSLDFSEGSVLADAVTAALADTLREFANPTPPKCPASLTLGRSGSMYHCSLDEAHTGPHADTDMLWSVPA